MLCQECGFCYYCRDFFSCVHYDADNKVFNYYVDIPALLLTSDKNLNKRLLERSLFVNAKKASNAIRIVAEQVKHRISRL
jgi:hypothetical protein